jgi:hypothetical protein
MELEAWSGEQFKPGAESRVSRERLELGAA